MSYLDHLEDDEVLVSRFPTHPGTLLKTEVLPARKVSGVQLSNAIGASRPDMTKMLNGKKPVTPLLAARIEAALDYPAELLLRLQSVYDLATVRRDEAVRLSSIERLVAAA
jgi:addiction module HigA family antidote